MPAWSDSKTISPYASLTTRWEQRRANIKFVLTLRREGGIRTKYLYVGSINGLGEPIPRHPHYAMAMAIVANGTIECSLEDESCKGELQIDHMLGDGVEERKHISAQQLYGRIVNGKRKTDDLQILCRSHNKRLGGEPHDC